MRSNECWLWWSNLWCGTTLWCGANLRLRSIYSAHLLVFDQTLWQEGSSTVGTWLKCFCIERIKCFFVICISVINSCLLRINSDTTDYIFDDRFKLGRFFGHVSTLIHWKFALFHFKFLFAAFKVDFKTSFTVLPATDVAYQHVGSSCLGCALVFIFFLRTNFFEPFACFLVLEKTFR